MVRRLACLLPMLALLIPMQVHADTYTFDIATQNSITFGSVAGVSYTFTNTNPGFPGTFNQVFLSGNSGLNFGNMSVVWNNGTLSITPASASGWATAPPPNYHTRSSASL